METLSILVVEDDPVLRAALSAELEGEGLKVVAVGDGASAILQLTRHTFQAVCLDVILPETSGYEVCEQLRQSSRHRDCLVVMMSARAYPADCANALDAGADVFLAKPFSTRTLLEALRRAQRPGSAEAVA